MTEYRIYFLRETAIRGRHDFDADDDQSAIQIAHVLLDACSDGCHSFDLWSGTRRVAVPRLLVPRTFDEVSAAHQECVLDTEEQISNGDRHIARSRRLLESLESKKTELRFRHLAQAEGHVVEGMGHIARQQGIVADLKARGQDITQAEQFLDRLEQTQALHLAHRDRLRRELGSSDGPVVERA